MSTDAIWRVFAETGDPLCYLLYKSAGSRPRRNDEDRSRTGELPRPED